MIRQMHVDTGPFLALIDRREMHHAWVTIVDIFPPLLTCEAILTEACYLAMRTNAGAHAVLELFERGEPMATCRAYQTVDHWESRNRHLYKANHPE